MTRTRQCVLARFLAMMNLGKPYRQMEEDTKLMRSYLSTIRMEKQGRAQVSSMEIMRWEQRHIACMMVDMAARLQGSKLFFRIRQFLLMAVNCAIRPNGARVLPPKQQEITLPTGTASQGYFGLYTNGAKVGDTCSVSGYRAGEYKARISRDKIRKFGTYDLDSVYTRGGDCDRMELS